MYELKKTGKVFTSKFVGTGPSSYKNIIYQAAVSQRLRNTAPKINCTVLIELLFYCVSVMTAFCTRKKAVFYDVTPRSLLTSLNFIFTAVILSDLTLFFMCTVTSLYEFNDCLAREQR
jgi:antibiotic biosynthesis monooxygenase (ABM) superfamily enzyme